MTTNAACTSLDDCHVDSRPRMAGNSLFSTVTVTYPDTRTDNSMDIQ